MKEYSDKHFTGERALYASKGVRVTDSIFEDGESPLKESSDVELFGCMFRWKYPLWYCKNVRAVKCTLFEGARAGIWYSDGVEIETAMIEAPKTFRRCRDLTLRDVSILNAKETLWDCHGVTMRNVVASGDYFGMNCSEVDVDGFMISGNYTFDGVKNASVRNARMTSRDSFWNCEHVVVRDSFITGEYLGWNSKDLTFENCVIESLQGLCYIDGLKMINCKLINTTLAFEYSTVDAEICSRVESVLNPTSGIIRADSIGELIVERDRVDASKTVIVCRDIEKTLPRPEWIAAPNNE